MACRKDISKWELNTMKEPGSKDANDVDNTAAHLASLIETGVPAAL